DDFPFRRRLAEAEATFGELVGERRPRDLQTTREGRSTERRNVYGMDALPCGRSLPSFTRSSGGHSPGLGGVGRMPW
ncbi:MAG TPA: hypothetical protein VHN13_03575, partial [Candidatus Tectomicrobia bacterium]|nr:hypothetical protein [Candidatus Tectomicrobia bacterium]